MASDERWCRFKWNSALILIVITLLLNNSNVSVKAEGDPSKISKVIIPTTGNVTTDNKNDPKVAFSQDQNTVKIAEDQQSRNEESTQTSKSTAAAATTTTAAAAATTTTTTTTTTVATTGTAPLTDAQQKKTTTISVGTNSSKTTSTVVSSSSTTTTTPSTTTILQPVDKSIKFNSNTEKSSNPILPEDDDLEIPKTDDDERLGLPIPDPSIPSPDQPDYQDPDGTDGDSYTNEESINKGSGTNNLNIDKKNENNDINMNKEATYWKTATSYGDPDDGNSHFFIYFLTVVGMCILMYVLFHNKQKILALIVEGRQERRRRPNTSQYRPLDNNLEEVIQGRNSKNGRTTNDSEN